MRRAGSDASSVQISLQRQVSRGYLPSARELQRWSGAALGRAGRSREVSVLLVTAARSRALNARYRQRDRSTNVLSFPASADALRTGLLGDLVLCPVVVRQEARAQRKTARAHWAHLVVHGALHLIGYDHEREADAQRMERREIRVLRHLGFDNPYRLR